MLWKSLPSNTVWSFEALNFTLFANCSVMACGGFVSALHCDRAGALHSTISSVRWCFGCVHLGIGQLNGYTRAFGLGASLPATVVKIHECISLNSLFETVSLLQTGGACLLLLQADLGGAMPRSCLFLSLLKYLRHLKA